MSAFYEIDLAFISLCLFFAFFAGLIVYLRREDRREGYPLEEDQSGRRRSSDAWLFFADAKKFVLPHGLGTVIAPENKPETRSFSFRRVEHAPGSPYEPVGDPMLAGVGPGSWAVRPQRPELTSHGEPRIVPLRVAPAFHIAEGDQDPRGYAVYGCDGLRAGTVSDAWIDLTEVMIRYLEVTLDGDGKRVLVPLTQATMGTRRVDVDSITAAQFANIPQVAKNDQITLDEEERIVAYHGAGYLYATQSRKEPLL